MKVYHTRFMYYSNSMRKFLLILLPTLVLSCDINRSDFTEYVDQDLLISTSVITQWNLNTVNAATGFSYLTGTVLPDNSYHLNYQNLMINGDFFHPISDPAMWKWSEVNPGSLGNEIVAIEPPGHLHLLTDEQALFRLSYNLSDLADGLEGIESADGEYSVHMDIMPLNAARLKYFSTIEDEVSGEPIIYEKWTLDDFSKGLNEWHSFPYDFLPPRTVYTEEDPNRDIISTFSLASGPAADYVNRSFILGSNDAASSLDVNIDNIRIYKTSINSSLNLSKTFSITGDTLLKLYSGKYRFTLEVKHNDSKSDNEFDLDFLEIELAVPAFNKYRFELYDLRNLPADWTELTFETDFIQLPVDDDAVAFTLTIRQPEKSPSPFLDNTFMTPGEMQSAGSILIRNTRLYYLPE